MKKSILLKNISVYVIVFFLISLFKVPIYAKESTNPKYVETNLSERSIAKDAQLYVYKTQNGGKVELINKNSIGTTFTQGIGFREYKAIPEEGWMFDSWTYEQIFNGNNLGNRFDYGWGKRYSFSNSGRNWGKPYNDKGDTISVNRLLTVGETQINPILYKVYANFNPTITASINNGTITDKGQYPISYGGSKSYQIRVDNGYVIEDIFIDGKPIEGVKGMIEYVYKFDNVINPHTIKVVVNPKQEGVNSIPAIKASDRVLVVGDMFQELDGVTAYDNEDGDITELVEVLKSDVNTENAGIYSVTYKVSDSKGATSIKTIKVVVNPKQDNDLNDPNDSKTDDSDKIMFPHTGDSMSKLFWIVALSISTIIMVFLIKKEYKVIKSKNKYR